MIIRKSILAPMGICCIILLGILPFQGPFRVSITRDIYDRATVLAFIQRAQCIYVLNGLLNRLGN